MSQEIEIEFKNIVSKEHFHLLCEKFQIETSDFQKQVNYYFETPDFDLKKHGSALRIREKNGQYTLTLKQPHEVGLLETHQVLTETEALAALKGETLPSGQVANQLYTSFQLNSNLCKYIGALTTNRAEIQYLGGILVFDHSIYFDTEDFELEYEVKNEKQGQINFEILLRKFQIPMIKTDNKIKRFFLKHLNQL